MVSTRSTKTNYNFSPARSSKLVKSNSTPVSQYFVQLNGREKSEHIRYKKCPFNRMALVFHWFLRYLVPIKKPGVEESFDSLFLQVRSSLYPSHVRAKFSKARQRKSEAIIQFKEQLRTFYDPVYGVERLFDVVPHDILGHKVLIHPNMLKAFGNARTGKIPFHAVSDNLLGSLFASPQSDILTALQHDSMYEYRGVKYLLVGPLYFIPHHCDSTLSFSTPTDMYLFDMNVPTTKLSSDGPHDAYFRVGDEVNVNYHMGKQPSSYNFTCQCGSVNCMSIVK